MSARASVGREAALFAALGDETRIRLLTRLGSGGPQSIARLSAKEKVSRQAITKHLDVLAEAGLVRDVRKGRERIWRIEPKRFESARGYLERVSRSWDEALGRLKE